MFIVTDKIIKGEPFEARASALYFDVSKCCYLSLKEKLCSPVGLSLNRRFAFKHHNSVCQIGCHDEIMLDNKTSLFGVKDETVGENIFEEKKKKVRRVCRLP